MTSPLNCSNRKISWSS